MHFDGTFIGSFWRERFLQFAGKQHICEAVCGAMRKAQAARLKCFKTSMQDSHSTASLGCPIGQFA